MVISGIVVYTCNRTFESTLYYMADKVHETRKPCHFEHMFLLSLIYFVHIDFSRIYILYWSEVMCYFDISLRLSSSVVAMISQFNLPRLNEPPFCGRLFQYCIGQFCLQCKIFKTTSISTFYTGMIKNYDKTFNIFDNPVLQVKRSAYPAYID